MEVKPIALKPMSLKLNNRKQIGLKTILTIAMRVKIIWLLLLLLQPTNITKFLDAIAALRLIVVGRKEPKLYRHNLYGLKI